MNFVGKRKYLEIDKAEQHFVGGFGSFLIQSGMLLGAWLIFDTERHFVGGLIHF